MADESLAEPRSRVQAASAEWQEARAALGGLWADARSASIDAQHLGPAGQALSDLQGHLASQDDADSRARGHVRLVVEQTEAAERWRGELAKALDAARGEVAEARAAARRAEASASACSAQVADALRLVGRAGVGCGQAVGVEAMRGELGRLVVRERRRSVYTMAGKAAAVEVSVLIGKKVAESLVESALHAEGGVDMDAIVDTVRESHSVMRAQITQSVKSVLDRLGAR